MGKKEVRNVEEDLQELASVSTSKDDKNETRTVFTLGAAAREMVNNYAPLKLLVDIFTKYAQTPYEALKEVLAERYMDQAFALKKRPANPVIRVEKGDKKDDMKPDITANFIVQENFDLDIPELAKDETPADGFRRNVFKKIGKKVGKKLLEEVSFVPEVVIRPFKELMHGHYFEKKFVEATEVEKSAGEKLRQWVLNTKELTPEERKAILVSDPKSFEVKEGFLDRLPTLVDTRAELSVAWSIFRPITLVRDFKFGINDTEAQKIKRLTSCAKSVMGETPILKAPTK